MRIILAGSLVASALLVGVATYTQQQSTGQPHVVLECTFQALCGPVKDVVEKPVSK